MSVSMPSAHALKDLVGLISSTGGAAQTHTLPSAEAILNSVQLRYKADLPSIRCGHATLVHINPLKPLASLNDASAQRYIERIAGNDDDAEPEDEGEPEAGPRSSSRDNLPPHPYDTACKAHLAMQRTGKSQAIVLSGLSGSGKTYTAQLVTSQLLRIAVQQSFGTGAHQKVLKLRDQIKAAETLLDAFGACKTASCNNATRQGRLFELHFAAEDSVTSILSGAKVLTFGFDKSRLSAPLGREERSFHIFYQFLAGASNEERDSVHLLSDPSQYNLLASSGCYRIDGVNDAIAFGELREAFATLGFKPRHLEMIYKILSAVLLLSNLAFSPSTSEGEDSLVISADTREEFETVAGLLGLPTEDFERALVNKTSYMRKEVVTTVLDEEGAYKQRDSLMSALYAIIFSYIVESTNHRLYPGDEAIKKLQRDSGAASIVLLDMPGFQTKSPSGGVVDNSGANARRSTLIQAYGEDGYEQFTLNYGAELLQHWLNKRAFYDDAYDAVKQATGSDGIKLPDVDFVDTCAATLELLRGGGIGTRADSKPGGFLGGLSKSCSNLRKGKVNTEEAADVQFMEGLEERFRAHSRFIPRTSGTSQFSIKHYSGTVAYTSRNFVEKDLNLLDSEFVRLFRSSSSESFLAKLFSGPSLAAESHPRDPSVLVATQISSQPLRRLSPLKVSRTASTSVSPEAPEPDISPVTMQLNDTLTDVLAQINDVYVWNIACLRPNDNLLPGVFDVRRIKAQLEALDVRSLLARKRVDIFYDSTDVSRFVKRYAPIGAGGGGNADNLERFLTDKRRLEKGTHFFIGPTTNTVWLSYDAWLDLELALVTKESQDLEVKRKASQADAKSKSSNELGKPAFGGLELSPSQDGFHSDGKAGSFYGDVGESSDDLLRNAGATAGFAGNMPTLPYDSGDPARRNDHHQSSLSLAASGFGPGGNDIWGSDLKGGLPATGTPTSPAFPGGTSKGADGSGEKSAGGRKGQTVEEVPSSNVRRAWLVLVWALTWYIPSFLLSWIGRMKRPDVRIAWREKVALCLLVFLFCGTLLFLMLGLGLVMCPQFNYAWNAKELSYHQGKGDVWVGVAGKVYDITKFYKAQHSDIQGQDATPEDMMTLAGKDLSPYFPVPLSLGCPGLVDSTRVYLQNANFTPDIPTAFHISGQQQSVQTSALRRPDWYTATFLPKMEDYYKGPMVYTKKQLQKGADDDGRIWAMYNKRVYDISDYVFTVDTMQDDNTYQFLPTALTDLFKQQPGTDITKAVDDLDERTLNAQDKAQALFCLDNVFYRGQFDFRTTPVCTFQGYFLLAFSVLLITTIAAKFVAALQITKKRNPELQDKFVICQVPCYTEGEESLKKTIDSLANLKYDDKRKLLFVICDGMIVGSGNDRPTPRIVLDILGVENLDPDPLLFKSLGPGSKQLNYGKVYSGLYEFEGHVLPYIVVVKVGKPTERSRPGNRGKRDSQILVMRFLNRVHLDGDMAPLELEIYHQIKNVIGVDPKLYEFLLTVDADTEVKPDALNRLVAVAADDSSIIGLCGETKLSNEQESWWTMIQVYEYYISHHLSKAFESLFGSVTCLPGCFTLFRLRTADKGRPLLISNLVIDDYSENDVDTLHKKNLLHLGEDRYLTTLMLKHFPHFKTKFASDARAMTAAPEKWNILLSQRRRWINSTVHNLFELAALKDLCGFCCFSMRFIVIIDLLGTIMLPATMVYLVYLIVVVATHKASIPIFSLLMIGAVYGLQVIIFLLKRQWQFIGWLVIYMCAYPVYSFFLPIYAFWHFDDFSWGNTRVVVGEGKNKKILAGDDDAFDDSMIPMRKFHEYQQQAWNMGPPARSPGASDAGYSFSAGRKGHSPQGSDMVPDYAHHYQASRAGSVANFPSGPQHAFSPFHQSYAGGYGSPAGSIVGAGSDYGGGRRSTMPTPPAFAQAAMRQSMMSFAPSQFGGPGSMLGMPAQPYAQPGTATARNSSYSLAQWAGPAHGTSPSMASLNPFADNSQVMPQAAEPSNPTDAELVQALRVYLRTQDLLQVTKRTTREAIAAHFSQADLSKRKNFLNQSIDAILQGNM